MIEYKNIKGFEGYKIGEDGSVLSCHNIGGWGLEEKWHPLKGKITNRGHLEVCLTKNNKKTYHKVHRLVVEHFLNLEYEKYQIYHIDGNKLNNHINNLEIIYDSTEVNKRLIEESKQLFNKNITYKQLERFKRHWFGSDGTCIKMGFDGIYKLAIIATSKVNGYIYMSINGKTYTIHPLICEAFHGPKPFPNYECCHNNGIRHDNRAENLRWDSHSGNMMDMEKHGTRRITSKTGRRLSNQQVEDIERMITEGKSNYYISKSLGVAHNTVNSIRNKTRGLRLNHLRGDKAPQSKLKESDVIQIREMYKTNRYTVKELSGLFNVSFGCIRDIIYRRNWKHI